MKRVAEMSDQTPDPPRACSEPHRKLNGHGGAVVWMTGLPGAGKSTLASELVRCLRLEGVRGYVIDGDTVRENLNKDLGFSAEDRSENVRRVGELAWMMAEAGLVVVVALVSPSAFDRNSVRKRQGPGPFIEVFVDAPVDVVIKRDPKGLYRRAMEGQVKGMTGIDAPYEPPASPELRLATAELTVQQCVDRLMDMLKRYDLIDAPTRCF